MGRRRYLFRVFSYVTDGNGVVHVDDPTSLQLLTLCGRQEAGLPFEGEIPTCDKCARLLTQLMLELGMPK
jgi:hypothetical protein